MSYKSIKTRKRKQAKDVFKSVDLHWRGFITRIFPDVSTVSDTQLREMQKAFYSGFWVAQQEMSKGMDASTDESFLVDALDHWFKDTEQELKEVVGIS